MPGLIGKKLGMTQLFDETGKVVPVCVIQAGPCTVIQRKTSGKDGYEAAQLGFSDAREKRVTKPVLGHFKKVGISPKRILKEFRLPDEKGLEVGSAVGVDMFEAGTKVNVTGTSRGKGFQGVVKRCGYSGGDDAHGCTTHRMPGSIGASAWPSRVRKNVNLPGRMGGVRVTVKNLVVVGIDKERNLLWVRGCVPGGPNSYVQIKKSS